MKSGVLVDLAGLQPTSKAVRIQFSNEKAHRDRRSFHGNQGTHRWILDYSGEVSGGSTGVGDAHQHRRKAEKARSSSGSFFELKDFGLTDEAVNQARNLARQLEPK